MATSAPNLAVVERLDARIRELSNQQFETDEFRRLFALPLTPARARAWTIHLAHFIHNRRDCWGYALGASPLDVKQLIWEHEREELIHDPRAGSDHATLAFREAELFGLTPEDILSAPLDPAAATAIYGWLYLAKDPRWLVALVAVSIIEFRNSEDVIRGGGFSGRMRAKLHRELGIPTEQLQNQNVHTAADVEHALILRQVLDRHVHTEEDAALVLWAVEQSLLVDRCYRAGELHAMELAE
jgi:pyrroloquinoline quinone (PQQ) biosynthesis protein C